MNRLDNRSFRAVSVLLRSCRSPENARPRLRLSIRHIGVATVSLPSLCPSLTYRVALSCVKKLWAAMRSMAALVLWSMKGGNSALRERAFAMSNPLSCLMVCLTTVFVCLSSWNAYAEDLSTTSDSNDRAVTKANRPFTVPKMASPSLGSNDFEFIDVGAKIPNYTPGQQWGTQGEPLTLMQKPLPAEKSLESYSVPSGFSLSLWAKESNAFWPESMRENETIAGLKGKPIAMNWDERGRLFVCETIDYPNELQSPGRGRDRIKICEDTNNDGQADKFTIFAENLSIPSTLVCYRGGVIVQDGTSTVYLKDIDGDDIADFRQVLITGWAMGDTHGGVSNFQYGPDNWIWAMQGYNNSEPIINGKPTMRFRQGFWRFKVRAGTSDETAPAFAIDPSTLKVSTSPSDKFDAHTIRVDDLELIRATNNNTWGLGFSEEGYVFGSTANGCPSVHSPIPNRYYDQVAGWAPKTLEKISPTHRFNAIDNQIRQVDWHGGYTAAAGHAIYTARNYPEPWWNRIAMVCEPTGHLVGAFVLEKSGAGYKSNNLFNVVASIDDWSAPIMSEVGPDGNVWVLDWYNYIVQHNPTPQGFQTGKGAAYESDLRDKRFARVYRLIFTSNDNERTPSSSMNLGNASDEQLVAALRDKNFFWRRTAQRLLVERGVQEPAILDALVRLVEDESMDEIGLSPAAMHAIWTLGGLASSGRADIRSALEAACLKGLQHPSSPVRAAAIEYSNATVFRKGAEAGLHEDVDPRVRLAFLLRAASDDDQVGVSGDTLAKIVGGSSTASDDILLDAWTSAASKRPVDVLTALTHSAALNDVNRFTVERIAVLAEHVARQRPTSDEVSRLLSMNPNSPLLVPIWEGLAKGWPRDFILELSADDQQLIEERFLAEGVSIESKAALLSVAERWSITDLQQTIDNIQSKLFEVALDASSSDEVRVNAWDQAIKIAPASSTILDAVEALFTPQLPTAVGNRALASLRNARVEGLTAALLQIRNSLGPQLSSDVLTLLLSRASTTVELLEAMERGSVRFTDLFLDQRQAIINHPDVTIAKRASELMKQGGAMVSTDRQALVEDWMPVTRMPGDRMNGMAMYQKHCAQCHQHGDVGVAIGPNLSGMAVHPREETLVHILDPSRSVENNFRTYQILTVDGESLTGMLAGESSNALRLINSQGKEETILREDIEMMKSSAKSLMPEGFEGLMTRQEMADLLAFLGHRDRYTPLSFSGVATLSTGKELPSFRGGNADKFTLPTYGKVEVEGIPFVIDDPQDGRVTNIIGLQRPFPRGPQGGNQPAFQTTLPTSVSLPCNGKIASIHILGGVATGAFPNNREESITLVVRCTYSDDSTTEYPLINGKHIANYQGKHEVPESKFAFEANGKQVRYLKIDIDHSKDLKSIELVKGQNMSMPLVFAVSVESADAH